eukprot:8395580-Alexandrium_andersonii.AAC.1
MGTGPIRRARVLSGYRHRQPVHLRAGSILPALVGASPAGPPDPMDDDMPVAEPAELEPNTE